MVKKASNTQAKKAAPVAKKPIQKAEKKPASPIAQRKQKKEGAQW